MALSVNQVYQFNVTYQGAVTSISYRIDFGDGTKTGWFNGALQAPTTVSHVFATTGQFSVVLGARAAAGAKVNRHCSCESTEDTQERS